MHDVKLTRYSDKITKEFVYECAKYGEVKLLSSQITIASENGLALSGLDIPSCLEVEYVASERTAYTEKLRTRITFKVRPQP